MLFDYCLRVKTLQQRLFTFKTSVLCCTTRYKSRLYTSAIKNEKIQLIETIRTNLRLITFVPFNRISQYTKYYSQSMFTSQ